MAGVGKLIKQAQKMQKKMESLQEELKQRTVESSAAGGAVKVVVNGQQEVLSLHLDAEFLKEEKAIVEETILEAFKDAFTKAKALNEEAMNKLAGGFQMPGLF